MLERQSALASALNRGGRDGVGGARRLRLGEVRGWSLVQIAAFASTLSEFEQVVKPLLGSGLAARVGEVTTDGTRRLFKTGPEQFWIVGPATDDLARGLQAAVAPGIGAVTPLSHSRTRIFVEGDAARELLAKGIPLDFHPAVFKVDQFALTGLHHTPILLHQSGENRYEIYAMRTFALSVWEWLTDAALPFGYEVAG
ncbi:MAG: methylglutamate dehydrogenase subunit [Rhodospirillaceae bacterium]|jgi:methylglutamate dehydrogenase subunit D|nr:methylglutamate dehydrogenase subunit [Rhodospirillaceae bacterium]